MYTSSEWLHDPLRVATRRPAVSSAPAVPRARSTAKAIALYFSGIFVETLGLALIAAYDWWTAGAVIAGAGVWIATVGNRTWPAPERPVTALGLIHGYLAARQQPHRGDSANNNRGR
jgi:hypothetical protein